MCEEMLLDIVSNVRLHSGLSGGSCHVISVLPEIVPLCCHKQVLGGEPRFTSCHGRVIATLDYIWYTRQAHKPMRHSEPCQPSASAPDDSLTSEPAADDASSAAGGSISNLASANYNGSGSGAQADNDRPRNSASHSGPESASVDRSSSCNGLSNPSISREAPATAREHADPLGTAARGVDDVSEWELVPTRVVLMPQLSSLRRGLPAAEYPSDHISLVAEFSVRAKSGNAAAAAAAPPAYADSDGEASMRVSTGVHAKSDVAARAVPRPPVARPAVAVPQQWHEQHLPGGGVALRGQEPVQNQHIRFDE